MERVKKGKKGKCIRHLCDKYRMLKTKFAVEKKRAADVRLRRMKESGVKKI